MSSDQEIKHLWQYNNNDMEEIIINHLAKNPYFDSWKEFMEHQEKILNCNCMYMCPLIYWSWKFENPECEELEECDCKGQEFCNRKQILTLIFPSWSSDVSSIRVLVNRTDEQDVRDFIQEHQFQNI